MAPMLQAELETMPPARRADLQWERAEALLRRLGSSGSSFWEDKLAAVDVDAAVAARDLSLLPFTAKPEMRDTYPFGMLAVPIEDTIRIHASSGTRGKPTVVAYTAADLAVFAEVNARAIACAGGTADDVLHVAYGYGLFTGGLGAHYGAERLGCTVIPVSGGMTPRQIQLICDLAPEIIMVTPTYMLTLIDEFERQGVDPRGTSLRVGIFGAEPWTEQMRDEIEQRTNIDAVDIYRLSEVLGPGVTQECVETKDGLHI